VVDCESEFLDITASGKSVTRQEAAMILVIIDSSIVIIFLIAVFRLKWYEDLFERDRQLK
jgi:hypothetical protein